MLLMFGNFNILRLDKFMKFGKKFCEILRNFFVFIFRFKVWQNLYFENKTSSPSKLVAAGWSTSIWIGLAPFVKRLSSFCAAEFVDTVWMEKINLPFFVDSFFSWLPFIPADGLILDKSPIISIADDKAVRSKLFAITFNRRNLLKQFYIIFYRWVGVKDSNW